MAVVTTKGSINIDNLDSDPIVLNSKLFNSPVLRQVETVAIAAADDDTSTYTIARVPSNAVLSNQSEIENDAITGGTDFNVGFYYTDGTVIDDNALLDALDLSSATSTKLLSGVDKNIRNQEVWQLAGLSSDPKKMIDIVLTSVTVGTAAGDITMETFYTV
jgi:hypothetical protein